MRARLSYTLFFYLAWNFLRAFLIVFALLAAIGFLIDLIELFRRTASAAAPWSVVILMAVYKIPSFWQVLMPFAILLGTMVALVHLLHTRELVALRSNGISAWQFLAPGLCLAFLIGIFNITVLNPVISLTNKGFENLEKQYLERNASKLVTLSNSGLWLRENRGKSEILIHMDGVLQKNKQLIRPSIFLLDRDGQFQQRIEGTHALIRDGYWLFPQAKIFAVNRMPLDVYNYRYVTDLDFPRLYENFARPESFTFWQLPSFIALMHDAGLSAKRHKIYYYSLLALPFFFVSMLMIGAAFSLRLNLRSSRLWLIIIGISGGFIIYFVNNMFYKLALSQKLPAIPALIAPLLIGLLLSVAFIFHTEDG